MISLYVHRFYHNTVAAFHVGVCNPFNMLINDSSVLLSVWCFTLWRLSSVWGCRHFYQLTPSFASWLFKFVENMISWLIMFPQLWWLQRWPAENHWTYSDTSICANCIHLGIRFEGSFEVIIIYVIIVWFSLCEIWTLCPKISSINTNLLCIVHVW